MSADERSRGLPLPVIVALVFILPAVALFTVDRIQRHRYRSLVDRLNRSIPDLTGKTWMTCLSPSGVQLASKESKESFTFAFGTRDQEADGFQQRTWDLQSLCGGRHEPRHGLRIQIVVRQDRRWLFLSPPRVSVQSNATLHPSLEPLLQRALEGLTVDRSVLDH